MSARQSLVKGWLETLGPTTAANLAARLALDEDAIQRSLEMIEAEGSVLRGKFTPGIHEVEWCDRRTLARIHRYTQAGFRQRLEPVDPPTFLVALFEHHGLSWSNRPPADRSGGPAGLMAVIEQLAGFEASAGAWESDLFASRCSNYDPAWLDQLTWTGQVGWGRLQPPGAASAGPPKKWTTGWNKSLPLSIFPREHLAWLLPADRTEARDRARGDALGVWEVLQDRGALFSADLARLAGLLPGHLDQALGELAGLGLITADGFASIRSLAAKKGAGRATGRRGRRLFAGSTGPSHAGRWSLFPPPMESNEQTWWARAERWADLLLTRYLVLFRDLLQRETAAPPWWQLVAVLRRWEAQGKVQGGRFIRVGSAEQFARPGVVDQLRRIRDESTPAGWAIVSAVDPLNLVGIATMEERVAAVPGSALVLWNGRWAGTHRAGQTLFHPDFPADLRAELTPQLPMPASLRRQRWESTLRRPSDPLQPKP
jgi:ATP-dependent Lhr-like helicase